MEVCSFSIPCKNLPLLASFVHWFITCATNYTTIIFLCQYLCKDFCFYFVFDFFVAFGYTCKDFFYFGLPINKFFARRERSFCMTLPLKQVRNHFQQINKPLVLLALLTPFTTYLVMQFVQGCSIFDFSLLAIVGNSLCIGVVFFALFALIGNVFISSLSCTPFLYDSSYLK